MPSVRIEIRLAVRIEIELAAGILRVCKKRRLKRPLCAGKPAGLPSQNIVESGAVFFRVQAVAEAPVFKNIDAVRILE